MPWTELFLLIVLTLINGFFAMSELAVVSSRRARLQQMAAEGRRGAESALRLQDDQTGFLSAVQIGITIIAILSGAFGEAAFGDPLSELLRPYVGQNADFLGSATVVVLIAYLSLVIGELVPKRIALNSPENIASFAAPILSVIAGVTKPAVWLLARSTELVMLVLGIRMNDESSVTEEEVKTLIAEGTQGGVFHEAERDMLVAVMRVADKSLRSIMVARPDIVWLDIEDASQDILTTIRASGHSRFLVSRGEIDEVVGVVHAKDLLEQMRDGALMDLSQIVREPLFVPEGLPVLKMLEKFRTSPVHMAVVLDEHGGIEGIVTPTDILVAIGGDLPEREGESNGAAVQREDGSWLFDGHIPVDEAERKLETRGMSGDDADYATLAGFVLSQIGHLPEPGEHFRWKAWRFEVVDLDGRRIDKVMATLVPEA